MIMSTCTISGNSCFSRVRSDEWRVSFTRTYFLLLFTRINLLNRVRARSEARPCQQHLLSPTPRVACQKKRGPPRVTRIHDIVRRFMRRRSLSMCPALPSPSWANPARPQFEIARARTRRHSRTQPEPGAAAMGGRANTL